MKNSPMRWSCVLILPLTLAVSCSPMSETAQVDPDPGAAEQATNRVDIPPMVRQNLGITFTPVEVRSVAKTLRLPGAFELTPRARREYRMSLSGHVELLVDQYEEVEEGQLLFRYRSPQWPELLHEIIEGEQAIALATASIDVARARVEELRTHLSLHDERLLALTGAELRRADLELERTKTAGAIPSLEAELALAETQLANAHRTHDHALHVAATAAGLPESELESITLVDGVSVPAYSTIDWIPVTATSRGVVEHIATTDGSFLEAPAKVMTVIDPTQLRFRAVALQADLPRFASADTGRLVQPGSAPRSVSDSLPARITLGLEAHPEDRTMEVLARPDGHASWARAGVAAFLELGVESSAGKVLAVPRSAVVRDGLVHVLFRRDPADRDRAIRIEADLGVDDGRWIEVKSGLSRTDEVVLDGAYELNLATQTSGQTPKGGHFHADGTFHGDDH